VWRVRVLAAIVLFALTTIVVSAQTTAFTYQGHLTDNGSAANGIYDLQFGLFDLPDGGTQQGSTITVSNVPVTNGLFTVQLDFGSSVFISVSGQALQIGVRPGGSTEAFTVLSPRVPITSTPYAIRTISAAAADTATTAVNAMQLGGLDASQYVLTTDKRLRAARAPTAGSSFYIQNTTDAQTSASFNIDGSGSLGGTLTAGLVNSTAGFNIAGNPALSFLGASNTLVLGTGTQNVQIPGNLTSGNASFMGSVASSLAKPDGSFANTSVYGANTTITPDSPNFVVHLQPCCQQITLVGNSTSAAMSESTVVGYGASAINSAFVDNCGIDTDCGYGGPPVIFGAFASGGGTSLGYKAFTGNQEAVAIGPQSRATSLSTFAIGDRAEALPTAGSGNEIVIGDAIRATGNGVIALGGGGAYTHNSVISFGYSSQLGQSGASASFANQQMLVGGSIDGNATFGIKDIYFGNGDVAQYGDWKNSTPFDLSINMTGAAGIDQNGMNLRMRSGRGTGAGTPGSFIVSTPFAGTTGSDSHSYIDRLQIDGLGNFTLLQGTRLQLQGSNSGTATIFVPADAGTPNLTIPSQSGTFTVLGNSTTGNGTMLATGSGSYTAGNCIMVDANGNLVDSGSPCSVLGNNAMSVSKTSAAITTNSQQDELSQKQAQINQLNTQIQTLQQQVEGLKKLICADHPDANMCKQQ